MASNCLFLGWKKPYEGRQKPSMELFGTVVEYFGEQVRNGTLESFEPVLLNAHGGDLNGFILLRGEATKIDALKRQDKFTDLMAQATVCLENFGIVEGVTEEGIQKRMTLYNRYI